MGEERVYIVYLDEPWLRRARSGRSHPRHPPYSWIYLTLGPTQPLWIVLFGRGCRSLNGRSRNCLWEFHEMRLKKRCFSIFFDIVVQIILYNNFIIIVDIKFSDLIETIIQYDTSNINNVYIEFNIIEIKKNWKNN